MEEQLPETTQEKNKLRHRAIYVLPNLFTTAALFAGFLSIIFSIGGNLEAAAYSIFAAAFMDGLDGKVARLTNSTSEFGIQYDSLSDLISFGMAPAMLVWNWNLQAFGRMGVGLAFLLVACAALRLARFNVAASVHTQKKFFIGLPSPAAGCTLASFALYYSFLTPHVQPYVNAITFALTLIAALLMVSRVRYFSFKEFDFAKHHPFQMTVIGTFLLVVIFSFPKLLFFPIFFIYILSGLSYTYLYVPYKNHFGRKHTPKVKAPQEI